MNRRQGRGSQSDVRSKQQIIAGAFVYSSLFLSARSLATCQSAYQHNSMSTSAAEGNLVCTQVISFVEKIPRDLLFVIRTQNLVRALCCDLGFLPRDRFRIYARLAARHSGVGRGPGIRNKARRWLRGIRFEVPCLDDHDFV